MSTDVEKLVVQLSADFTKYTNAMAKATGVTKKQLKEIQAGATQAGAAGEAAFTGATRGIQRFGQQAQKTSANVVNLRGQTANLAAQFQDIGVQLSSGTSPFQIALQQGTQISAVLGGAGAGGAVRALGAAFASIVSPVSLVTIGLIAAGGAAIQYFGSLIGDGEKSADELKKQSDLIQRVAKDWGDAVPGIAAYAEQLERAARAAELLEVAQGTQEQIAAKTKAQFAALAEEFRNTISLIPDVNREFGVLAGKVEGGSETTEDFQRVLDLLAQGLNGETSPAIQALTAALTAMQAAAAAGAAQIADYGNQVAIATGKVRDFASAEAMRTSTRAALQDQKDFVAELERRNSLTAEQIQLEDEAARVRADAERAGTVISGDEATRLARETLAAEKARADAAKSSGGGGGGGAKAASEAEREREAVVKLIEALEYEQSLIGLSALEKERMNALRKAGAAATEEERARIEAIVTATYAETEALRANEAALERLKGLSRDVLGGMFEDLRDGADAADVLANAMNRVAESLMQAGIDQLVQSAFPTPGAPAAGTNFLSRIFHQGGVVGEAGPSRMVPSSIFAGARRYHGGGVAGLAPGEVPAILQRGEVVLPKNARAGGSVHRIVLQDDSGRMAEVADQRIRTASGDIIQISTQTSLKAVNNNFSKMALESERRQR